jgi:hypothetical protein
MKSNRQMFSALLIVCGVIGSAVSQQKPKLAENAALRYWSAFAQMQDAAINDQQAKEINVTLESNASYDDAKYKDLVEANKPALLTMARGTNLPTCAWGVEYQLGSEAPVDYVRKALALGRINVLYALHLLASHDTDGATNAIVAGLRFSQDTGKDGTLFATLAAKSLLIAHLQAAESAIQRGLSPEQRSILQKALVQLGPSGLDWKAAARQELELPTGLGPKGAAAMAKIVPVYTAALDNPSLLPKLQEMEKIAPQPVADLIPNPSRIIQQRQDLIDRLQETRSKVE